MAAAMFLADPASTGIRPESQTRTYYEALRKTEALVSVVSQYLPPEHGIPQLTEAGVKELLGAFSTAMEPVTAAHKGSTEATGPLASDTVESATKALAELMAIEITLAAITMTPEEKQMPAEDRRVSGPLLLMMLAQAYYKMLESTISMASWCGALDLELNQSYFWVVTNLTNLLKNWEELRDFPVKFEPLFRDLYPSTIRDLEWEDMVAPNAEEFLSTVQRYVHAKGVYEPKQGSMAWTFIELYRPSVNTAIERADAYNKRMRRFAQKAFGGTPDGVGFPSGIARTKDSASSADSVLPRKESRGSPSQVPVKSEKVEAPVTSDERVLILRHAKTLAMLRDAITTYRVSTKRQEDMEAAVAAVGAIRLLAGNVGLLDWCAKTFGGNENVVAAVEKAETLRFLVFSDGEEAFFQTHSVDRALEQFLEAKNGALPPFLEELKRWITALRDLANRMRKESYSVPLGAFEGVPEPGSDGLAHVPTISTVAHGIPRSTAAASKPAGDPQNAAKNEPLQALETILKRLELLKASLPGYAGMLTHLVDINEAAFKRGQQAYSEDKIARDYLRQALDSACDIAGTDPSLPPVPALVGSAAERFELLRAWVDEALAATGRKAKTTLDKAPKKPIAAGKAVVDQRHVGPDWVTVAQAERMTGILKGTISQACTEGRIVCVGKGRKRLINPTSLMVWAADLRAKRHARYGSSPAKD